MSYRFKNEEWLGIYQSEVFGAFTLKIQKLDNGHWEWTLGTDSSFQKTLEPTGTTLSFPMKGVSRSRDECKAAAQILWELDPDFYPLQIHDGKMRLSLHFGWKDMKEEPEFFMTGFTTKRVFADGTTRRFTLKGIEGWD